MPAEELVALHRYWIYADRMRREFYASLNAEEIAWGPTMLLQDHHFFITYWYAGLYAVIEGWKELKLADETIDGLLASENTEALRRFRNAVYHFQKKFLDPRIGEIGTGRDVIVWIRSLHDAFGRYLLKIYPPEIIERARIAAAEAKKTSGSTE